MVGLEIADPTSPATKILLNFTVIVQDTIFICSPPLYAIIRALDLSYNLGSPAMSLNLNQYFPYERQECKPVLSMGAEPPSAPIDTQLFSLNDYTLTI